MQALGTRISKSHDVTSDSATERPQRNFPDATVHDSGDSSRGCLDTSAVTSRAAVLDVCSGGAGARAVLHWRVRARAGVSGFGVVSLELGAGMLQSAGVRHVAGAMAGLHWFGLAVPAAA